MKNLKQALLALAILVLASFTAFAQTGIKGTVKDKDSGDPVVLMNVFVEGQTSLATQTDFDGNYTLELSPGTYEIVFSSVEYGKTNKTVTVTAGEMQTVDMAISTATKEMNTVIVKTDKYSKNIEDVITSTEVIKPSVIQNRAATEVTAALEQAPGLTIVDNEPQLRAGSGYSFGAGSRVMILVDDLPMLSGDAGRPSWGFIPIENVEQIEVVKGASSVLYGSAALNGVINVRTAYPTSTPKTVINLNTGVWDKPKLEQAKWWGSDIPFYSSVSFLRSKKTSELFSFTLGGNLYAERSFLGPAPIQDSIPPMHEDVKPSGFTNRARLNFTTTFRAKKLKGFSYGVNANVMYSRSTSILIWNDDTTGLYRSRPGATTVTKQPQFNVDPYIKYYDTRGNTFSLNTRIYYINNNNDNNQQNGNTIYYGEFRYMKKFRKIADFTLSTGVMGQYVVGFSELYAGGTEGQVDRTQGNVGVYAQLDKKMWDRVNFTLGGRWEYFKEDTIDANRPIFRAGASARVAKASYVRASFGQGFRFPTIAEKYIFTDIGGYRIVPNPNLDPEDSWSAEIGFKQGIKIKKFLGYFDIAGFTNFYKNYVEFIAGYWDNPAPPPTSVLGFKSLNTGRARVSGVDVTLAGQGKFTDNFSLAMLMGYTYSLPVTLDPNKPYKGTENTTYAGTSSDTTNNILKYRYEHLVKADIEATYKTLSTGFSFRVYSMMRNVDNIFLVLNIGNVKGFRERHDGPEFVLDWRIAYDVTPTSKVSFVINNVLNREYALRPLVINPPRSFAVQYTLKM